MNNDIRFWTDRVINSANNNDRAAFGESIDNLMRVVGEIVSSALSSASHEEYTLQRTNTNASSKKKYNLPKAE